MPVLSLRGFPRSPVLVNGLSHVFNSAGQKIGPYLPKMPANLLASIPTAQVDVRRFPAHGVEQAEVVATARQQV